MLFCGRVGEADGRQPDVQHARVARILGEPVRAVAAEGAALFQSLRAVTPEDARERLPQPFAGGRRILLFDGRLDNRDELTRALAVRAEAPDGAPVPDGALVAAAFERWDDDAPARLLGDFALAVWEPVARRLLLAADPVGARTVFYHVGRDRLVFGTHPVAVRAFAAVPRGADDEALRRFLQLRLPEEGRSYLAGIDRLPLGGRLTWRVGEGAPRVDRHRTLDLDGVVRHRHADDYAAAARALLDAAVGARLRARGAVASHLSGGLDSGGVAATAARLLAPATLPTVTIVPDPAAAVPRLTERFVDEWGHAGRVAALHPNIAAHRVCAAELADDGLDAERWVATVGEPLARPTQLAWFFSARATLRTLGADVLLNGGVGNVTLSWHAPRLLGGLARAGHLRAVAGLIARRVRHDGYRAVPRALRGELLPGVLAGRADGIDPDRRLRASILHHHLTGQALMASLRAYDGLEWRDPYSDRRLVEFCFAIPPEQCLIDGRPRSLARRALADRLPPIVVEERRRGRQTPEWFARMTARRDRIMADVARMERSPHVAALVDVARLRRIAEAWPADADEAERRYGELRHTLTLGVAAGQFVLWAEGPG